MTTRRQIQVADEIQQIVSVLLQRDMKDPRIGFVTVTSVTITGDLKYARIFVSVMGTPEEQKATMDALFSSRGYVRRELASRMSIRAVPEIQFKLDHGVEYSDRINRLLNELKEEDAKKVSDTVVISDDGESETSNDVEVEESATPPQEESR